MMGSVPRIGYVLKRFPRISETFILNEILELERQGTSLEIFSLLDPEDGLRHQALSRVSARVTYLPRNAFLKKCHIQEGRYTDGCFSEQPLQKLFNHEERAPATLLFQAAAVAGLAAAKGVQHLHAHFGTDVTTAAMLAGRLSGISYSFTAHAKDIYDESVDPTLLKMKMTRARFVITVSDYNRRYLAHLAGEDSGCKVLRLYNGIDLNRFQSDPLAHREPGLILSVGRLVEKKGFRHLVEACRGLKDAGCRFRCLIVGSGPEQNSLSRQIAVLGLKDHVTLLRAQPQGRVLELMREASVFVLPCVVSTTGDQDGLPTVLLEALAVGLPAISTTLAGIPEIIEHEKTGHLVPPEDPRRLAKAIREVLANPGLQERFAREGRSKAEEVFDIQKNAQILRGLFTRSTVGPDRTMEPVLDEDRVPLVG